MSIPALSPLAFSQKTEPGLGENGQILEEEEKPEWVGFQREDTGTLVTRTACAQVPAIGTSA